MDYCTLWFEGSWSHCCKTHDEDYLLALSLVEKLSADLGLASCVAGTGNPLMAGLMFLGVSIPGIIAWAYVRYKSSPSRN